MEEAFWVAGAKAAAVAMREEAMMSFMLLLIEIPIPDLGVLIIIHEP